MIPFNKPSITALEENYISDSLATRKLCGDGSYTRKAGGLFKEKLGLGHVLLTASGTHALEMTAILADLKPGDEVIAPSYTFVSTVNAFILRGARPVFAEIEEKTLNIDAGRIEELITEKTRAIYPVHYAGVICDMDRINAIAKKHNLLVIEDAAQAVGSVYRGRFPAGAIGDMGCFSFHETKNYVMGEGGAIVLKDGELFKRAEIIREKGTDRSKFIRGEVDKYTWVDIGSSYLPPDMSAALLCAQMERFDEIMQKRLAVWNAYHQRFEDAEKQGRLVRPFVPGYTTHNAHMYYVLLPTKEIRDKMIVSLREKGVQSVFHYIPLHSAPMGRKFGCKEGDLPVTEDCAGRVLRLPMWAELSEKEVEYVVESLLSLL